MKKYLVTGGAGFIGSALVDALLEQKNEVIVVDNFSSGKGKLNPKAEAVNLDISKRRNRLVLCEKMEGVDTVFHCAALARVQPSIQDPQRYHKTNVDGTFNVLMSARDSEVRRVVYSASSSAYGDQTETPQVESMPTAPISPYGLQKLIGEQYCFVFSKCYGLETVSLRYFNVYGEGQVVGGAYSTVVGLFLKQRQDRTKLTITNDGEQRRDFTYVGDVVRANILASQSEKVGAGEVINIGKGGNYSVNEIAEIIGGETENIGERPEPRETLADNTLAKELLDWTPKVDIKDWLNTKENGQR
jgi:UDP-glucose 4-epimerase|tara:strand:+ start:13147 stop:14052 length:906 start_codon:yes stop_codon:yes gene_type:complete